MGIEKWEKLQYYVAERIQKWDPEARPTKASGGSTELGDVQNQMFMVECKQREVKHPKIDVDVYAKNKALLPIDTDKIPILALENEEEKRFIALSADDFFDIVDNFFETLEDMQRRLDNYESSEGE